MNDEDNAINAPDELPIDAHKNFFAKELGIRRRGRPTVIDEEKNSATECRVRLSLRQERIVTSLQKELDLSITAIVKRFVDEGIKRWANQGRDKFDLSYKVKKVYEETVSKSINPIAAQVAMMNQKMDSVGDELAHLAIELGSVDETGNKTPGGLKKERENQTALRLLLTMNREVISQNELLVDMMGSILKWTPAFQQANSEANNGSSTEDKFTEYLEEARTRTRKTGDASVRNIIREDKIENQSRK
jgi:hypothetical protein